MIKKILNQRIKLKEKNIKLETELGNATYSIKKGSANTIMEDITLKNKNSNTLNYILQQLEKECYKQGAHELVLDMDLNNEFFGLFQNVIKWRNYSHIPGIPLTTTITYYKNIE